MPPSYHHGDLRRAVMDRSIEVIAAEGPAALNLRAVAASLGVTHTAPRHHFGSKEGLLTAIAAEGFRELTAALVHTREAGGRFVDLGVTYVEAALARPGHFAVMFQPTLLRTDDPELVAARDGAFGELRAGVGALAASGAVEDAATAVIAAWSLVHGVATLALTGNLDTARIRELVAGGDVLEITRRAASMLFGSPEDAPEGGPHEQR